MSLQTRLGALITAIGADIKSLKSGVGQVDVYDLTNETQHDFPVSDTDSLIEVRFELEVLPAATLYIRPGGLTAGINEIRRETRSTTTNAVADNNIAGGTTGLRFWNNFGGAVSGKAVLEGLVTIGKYRANSRVGRGHIAGIQSAGSANNLDSIMDATWRMDSAYANYTFLRMFSDTANAISGRVWVTRRA